MRRRFVSQMSVSTGAVSGLLEGGATATVTVPGHKRTRRPPFTFSMCVFSAAFNWCRSRVRL